ncbi:hypothetical protein GMMP13_900037 [Candidatus Magnetomoraceae bacterium gMMP-13]
MIGEFQLAQSILKQQLYSEKELKAKILYELKDIFSQIKKKLNILY